MKLLKWISMTKLKTKSFSLHLYHLAERPIAATITTASHYPCQPTNLVDPHANHHPCLNWVLKNVTLPNFYVKLTQNG